MAIDRDKLLQSAQKYVEKKKYDKAVAEYHKLVAADPNDTRTLLKIGDLQTKMLAFPDAIATYEQVAKLYAQQGFAVKAIAVYKQVRDIIAKHAPQLEEKYGHIAPKLAELYQGLGLVSDALAALDEVATRLQRQQRDHEAIDVFRKIVALDPTNPLPHLRLAEALSRAKDIDGAVFEFKTAASQLAGLGRRDDALKVLERLLHHRPDPDQARIAAELYLARGHASDGMQALAKLQICFQANPRDFDTLALLARAFNLIGQATKAIEVQKEMARVARDTGRADLFRDIVSRLLQLAPADEAVRKLAAQVTGQPAAPPPPARPPAPQSGYEVARGGYPPSSGQMPSGGAAPYQQHHAPQAHAQYEEEEAEEYVEDAEIVEADDEVAPPPAMHQHASPGSVARSAPVSEDKKRFQITQLLRDAQSFRRVRLYSKALESLRSALSLDVRSIEINEAYRDVLIEAGQTREAIDLMLAIASLYVDALDAEAAARSLQDVLAFEPENARAIEMLGELGYEVVSEDEEIGGEVAEEDPAQAGADRLPSYDLEEMGPSDVSPAYGGRPQKIVAGGGVGNMEDIDDPSNLPSFPLETKGAPAGAKANELDDATAPSPELDEVLEEIEFFVSRGLFEDARVILEDQLRRYPNNPLLTERMADVSQKLEAIKKTESGAREKPNLEDRAFDIAADLGEIELNDETEGFRDPTEQVDVEEVFAAFKEGVAQQISIEDSESHYNLAIAYKEMGLIDDAIREFETAARDPNKECVCQSMIGMIYVERGNINEAIEAYKKGLSASVMEPQQEAMMSYEIGAAFEAKKLVNDALHYYEVTLRLAPSYRDIQERVRRLRGPAFQAPRQAAVGADDEFDRAFDDLLDKS